MVDQRHSAIGALSESPHQVIGGVIEIKVGNSVSRRGPQPSEFIAAIGRHRAIPVDGRDRVATIVNRGCGGAVQIGYVGSLAERVRVIVAVAREHGARTNVNGFPGGNASGAIKFCHRAGAVHNVRAGGVRQADGHGVGAGDARLIGRIAGDAHGAVRVGDALNGAVKAGDSVRAMNCHQVVGVVPQCSGGLASDFEGFIGTHASVVAADFVAQQQFQGGARRVGFPRAVIEWIDRGIKVLGYSPAGGIDECPLHRAEAPGAVILIGLLAAPCSGDSAHFPIAGLVARVVVV